MKEPDTGDAWRRSERERESERGSSFHHQPVGRLMCNYGCHTETFPHAVHHFKNNKDSRSVIHPKRGDRNGPAHGESMEVWATANELCFLKNPTACEQ